MLMHDNDCQCDHQNDEIASIDSDSQQSMMYDGSYNLFLVSSYYSYSYFYYYYHYYTTTTYLYLPTITTHLYMVLKNRKSNPKSIPFHSDDKFKSQLAYLLAYALC